MATSDHLNDKQFIKVFHISWSDTPPHLLTPTGMHMYTKGDNVHPEVLHMGDRRAALQIHRTHLHEYEIDPSVIQPWIVGDSKAVMDEDDEWRQSEHTNYRTKDFDKSMAGKQEQLWETIPSNPFEAVGNMKVIPYRNHRENPGSISYMIPKSLMRTGRVRHVGVTDLEQKDEKGVSMRSKLEKEEGMYQPGDSTRRIKG